MGDIFKEQLVHKNKTKKDKIISGLIILGAIFIILLSISIIRNLTLLIILILIAGYGAYWFIQRQNIEYEYVFTNGDLDIDKIINKSSRKRVLSTSVKNFEIMAHVEDKNYEHELSNFEKILDFSSGEVKSNTYAALFMYENQKVKMIFEPNEEILKGILNYIPRKLHIKK
ncbi:DUF6106 family protein [Defluviitalea phaphyphila]|uniref:DUF6106 family protein n=1 Tax=Defluviitalea phaphyphila TaxID=1473580 RepID=UPI000730BD39|nr:DUF6106 family protein [Defluviitalea phaphyphila]